MQVLAFSICIAFYATYNKIPAEYVKNSGNCWQCNEIHFRLFLEVSG